MLWIQIDIVIARSQSPNAQAGSGSLAASHAGGIDRSLPARLTILPTIASAQTSTR
jgi:hypothetical protein